MRVATMVMNWPGGSNGNMAGGAAGKLVGMLGSKLRKACNSLEGETLIAAEFGLVPIKEVKIGDRVWAFNEETGERSLQTVVHLIQSEGQKNLVDIGLATGATITATDGHPFFVSEFQSWLDAGDLTPDHILQNYINHPVEILNIYRYQDYARVYNLTVDNLHTFYVGNDRILNHNSNCDLSKVKIDGIFPFVSKPRLHTNTKHVKGGIGNRSNAGIEPEDAYFVFDRYALFDGKHWWAAGQNGALYRYSKTTDDMYHWSGSTKDLNNPLDHVRVPPEVKKMLGVE